MANTQLRFLALCVYVVFQLTTCGARIIWPSTRWSLSIQIVHEGTEDIIFPCETDKEVSWTVRPTSDQGNTFMITNYSSAVDPQYSNLFDVNQTGLIIRTAQSTPAIPPISTSGVYFVTFSGTSSPLGFKLTVIREGPLCSCDSVNTTNIRLNCSITYAEITYRTYDVRMYWTSYNGRFYLEDIPEKTTADQNLFTSKSVISVNDTGPSNYQCTVTFIPTQSSWRFDHFTQSCTASLCNGRTTETEVPFAMIERNTYTSTSTPATTSANPATTPANPATTPANPATTPATPATTSATPATTPATPATTSAKTATVSAATDCDCAQTSACPSLERNCKHTSECRSDGTNMTNIYDECVVKVELYSRSDNCCPDKLACGVVVTLRNDTRWLIHDSVCDDNKCEMVVVNASCMSSDWKLLVDRKITTSGVADFVRAGDILSSDSVLHDCSSSCYRMMKLL